MNTKNSNPKDSIGSKKVPFSTVSAPVMAEVGLGMLDGACKYGRHNYRAIGVRASVYYDATIRHLTAWWEGENNDPDSPIEINHVTKAISSLMVLRDSMINENWTDDRPPKVKGGWVKEYNERAAKIVEKYPEPVEPYTELNKKLKFSQEEKRLLENIKSNSFTREDVIAATTDFVGNPKKEDFK